MTEPPQQTLSRSDLIAGLHELLLELRRADTRARIRIVGGAAIALTVNAERPATVDIDGPLEPAEPVLAAARRIADRHGWRSDWINDAAARFVPTGFGDRPARWLTIHDDDQVQIQVADPETLLAMKLHAAQRRGNRDARDLLLLLPYCQISSVEQAAELYEAYYPGDELTDRSREIIERLLAMRPALPTPPPPPDLD